MFGFIFGTVCLLGLVGVARRAACGARYGGCGGGGWHGRGWHGGGWHGEWYGRGHRGGRHARFASEGFARAASEVFKRRLDIDEEQEPIVDHAFVDLRKAGKELVDELKDTRKTLADAFAGEAVDEAALAAAFARHDDATARARRDIVSAFKQIHAVLDPEQRKRAAAWLAAGEGGWA